MLLTGDTEADEANAYADAVGDIDVLKVGHHGSAASVDEEMLAALTPELAVASAGGGQRLRASEPGGAAAARASGLSLYLHHRSGRCHAVPRR